MKHYSIEEYYKANRYDNIVFDPCNIVDCQQIGNKQAWILTDKFGVKWLQSYRTIVSRAICGKVVHFGKWSVTTSRHQSKFASIV